MRALPSPAVTMRDPSGLNAAKFTRPPKTAISLPLAASQMRAALSPDAVTMRDPLRLHGRSRRAHSRRTACGASACFMYLGAGGEPPKTYPPEQMGTPRLLCPRRAPRSLDAISKEGPPP